MKLLFTIAIVFLFLLFSCLEKPEYPEDKSSVSALVYGNNKFIAGFGWAKMSISENGKDWISVNNPFETYTTDALAYGNGVFVAGSVSGMMAHSNDGENWNLINNSTFGTSKIYSICYGDDKFVAVGQHGKMAYSINGEDWVSIINTTFVEINDVVQTVVYGDNKFIAGGNNRYGNSKMAYSINGIDWQTIYINNIGSILSTSYGNNRFILGSKNKIGYSFDGINWVNTDNSCFGENETIRSIAYGDGIYLAVGGGGNIAYSTDGVEWNNKNHKIDTNGFLHTIYANGIFLVGDFNGKITIFNIYDF